MTEDPSEAATPAAATGDRGRAYSGPLHGMEWALAGAAPPAVLELTKGELRLYYRLVRHPRSQRPVRDDHGSYVYVPERDAEAAPRWLAARSQRLGGPSRWPA